MKSITLYIVLLGCLGLMLNGCTQQTDDSPVFPSKSWKEGSSEPSDQVMSGGGTQGLTLAQVDACPYTDLVPVPAGYVLGMKDAWTYTNAFLLIHLATGDTTGEVYENAEIKTGNPECTLKWESTPVSVCCDTGGDNCRMATASNGAKAYIKC